MNSFQYVTAQTPESAADLASGGGVYLAGGIDILGELKEYLAQPKTLINIKSLPDTHEIKPGGQSWAIGANVTVAQIAADEGIRKTFPGLAQAALEVGSPQIRNVATVGGNLSQHSRCWYYRHRDVHCLKKGGATCYAREGENKYHAIFSGNPCISPVVSNLAIAMSALDATVILLRDKKITRLPIAELYSAAWVNPLAHNSLNPGDLILRVELPASARLKSAYTQVSEKSDFDWALVSCAAAATVDGERLSGARVVLGAISPVPHEVKAANAFLEGKKLDDSVAAQAAALVLKGATLLDHNAYKAPMATALIRRTLLKLIG